MIKGDVFNKQSFPSNTFALFMDTFLNKKCGVIADYKNGMALSNTSNQVTVSSGALCIRGRFIREDSSTTLNVSYQSNTYCKLIIEIDLDKVNTISELNQVTYKILSSETAYPTLVQTDIVKNESGIYQYELARFMCNSSGISQFTDMRTFLDFGSIYDEIREHIEDIDEGSIYLLKTEATDNYLSKVDAANTYMPKTGSSTFMEKYSILFHGSNQYGPIRLNQKTNSFHSLEIDYVFLRDGKSYEGSKIIPAWAQYFSLSEQVYKSGEKTVLSGFTSYRIDNNDTIVVLDGHEWQMTEGSSPVFNNNKPFIISNILGMKTV